MNRRTPLTVHIDHLVAEVPAGAAGRRQLQAALEAELSRLFAEHSVTRGGGSVRTVTMNAPGLSQAASAARAGELIAESIHRAVTGKR